MPFLVKKELLSVPETIHGGIDYAKLRNEGLDPESIIDFSVSVNHFPLPHEVGNAVLNAHLDRYPDSSSGELRAALAELNSVSPCEILVTNGLAQAIFLAAFAFCERKDRVLIASPTFGEYESASALAGAEIIPVPARPGESFAFPLERLIEGVKTYRPSLVWVCSPNNPTGALPSKEGIAELLRVCEQKSSLLLIDEAYISFAPPGSSARSLHPSMNMLLFRSMTKDYSMTGLRLGYVLGRPELLRPMAALQPPWSVNACAQAAGLEALRHGGLYEAQWIEMRRLAESMYSRLIMLGYSPLPPSANFILFRVSDISALKDFLWRDRILVRDCTSFGLPGYVRIGVRSEADNEHLMERLAFFRRSMRA